MYSDTCTIYHFWVWKTKCETLHLLHLVIKCTVLRGDLRVCGIINIKLNGTFLHLVHFYGQSPATTTTFDHCRAVPDLDCTLKTRIRRLCVFVFGHVYKSIMELV